MLDADDVHVGRPHHVPWLKDRKWAYIRMEGRNFGDVPLNLELKLEVWDSPDSAGVIIDAVRSPSWRSTAASVGRWSDPRPLHEVPAGAVPATTWPTRWWIITAGEDAAGLARRLTLATPPAGGVARRGCARRGPVRPPRPGCAPCRGSSRSRW